jgi:hypothetical protein
MLSAFRSSSAYENGEAGELLPSMHKTLPSVTAWAIAA